MKVFQHRDRDTESQRNSKAMEHRTTVELRILAHRLLSREQRTGGDARRSIISMVLLAAAHVALIASLCVSVTRW